MNTSGRWISIGLLALAVAGGVAVQRQRAKQARAELELAREQRRDWQGIQAENEQWRKRQETEEERARRARGEAELQRVRGEIATLQARLSEREAEVRRDVSDTWERPAAEWKNAGASTPRAALETALWAAAGGEIEVLGEMVALDATTRERAMRMQAEAPGGADYGTPERLIALMTAREVSPGTARLVSEVAGEEEAEMRVRLMREDGTANSVNLTLRRTAVGWKFVVPERAVERYAAMLKAGGT